MDDIVKQAMAKWPRVPHCSGWLGLDARGRWWLRDDAAQALGSFTSGVPGARGSLLEHDGLIAFIGRNYEADAQGQWFFQNGPQRVYVELEATPWIWRLQGDGRVLSHTGRNAQPTGLWLDEVGRAYLLTDLGFGLVHSQDVVLMAQAVEQGRWVPEEIAAAAMPARFGFIASPQQQAGGASDSTATATDQNRSPGPR
ncbi:DUF2946 domain-containing protein [Melaminivora suipulveris]|uniref:DUF2946 domain-containing protein n=1 Tax=Melaminivora suipulveris TaxID=2109913 RepID=A0A2R3QAW3_9BURK|nr:DUF2946 family protein [Melaminivora suipulveris]AVO48928.1 DUF2946 domain-containing protein [Melaminivora suipulveris]